MLLGHLIAAYREKHKLDMREVAQQIGIDHTGLWRFEHGQRVNSGHWCKILLWVLLTEPTVKPQPKDRHAKAD